MTWLVIRRQLVRLLVMIAVTLAAAVVLARPAAADICKDAPAPIAPKSGLPGMLTTPPKEVPDSAPDPFKDPQVPIGDVYGYSWSWSNYDLGCGSDFLRDPVAVTNTKSANVVMSFVGGMLAGLASLEQMAKSSSLDWLTTVVGGVADKLKGPLLGVWLPVALLAVGLIVGFRAKRSSYADTMRTGLIIVAAVGMAFFALVFPTVASHAVDRAVVTVADVAGGEFSASASDAVTREGAYRTWLTGNFGDPDSAVARDLGPRLLSATRYSWSDMKRMQAHPEAKKEIDAAKAAEFKKVATELQDRDPAGYEMFTGRGERTAPALMGVVVVVCMGLFVAMAMLMVLIGRVMMQGLALAAPLAAVLGVLPTHTSVLSRLWDLFTASIVAVAKFVIAGGVMGLVLGAIESNDQLGAGAKLFWVIVATVVGIVLTRPLHSLKTIVPGLDPNRSYLRGVVSGVTGYLGARFGAEDGASAAMAAGNAGAVADAAVRTSSDDASESLDALPRPVWVQQEAADGGLTAPTTTVGGGAAAVSASAGSTVPRWAGGQSWPGVAPRSSPRPELTTGSAQPQASDSGVRVTGETVVDTPMAGSLTLARSAGAPSVSPDDVPRPRATRPAESGTEVVYPTGIIVAAEDNPLYLRTTGAETAEVYLPMTDPDIAADGTEHDMVTYRSGMVAGRA